MGCYERDDFFLLIFICFSENGYTKFPQNFLIKENINYVTKRDSIVKKKTKIKKFWKGFFYEIEEIFIYYEGFRF